MSINNEVNITLTAKDKASKGLKNIEKNAGGLGSKLEKMKGPLKGLAIGLGAAGAAAGVAGAKLFNIADSVETTIGKAQTVFGEYFDDMDKVATTTAKAMGLTRSEYLKTAAGMADLLVPMGFQREEAAKMTQDTIGLAGALAEWSAGQYNAAEVGQILSKAMLGEREQLKSLGISISEADVQQRLLDNGAKDLTGTALQQAKAIATQQLIFEKSTDAQKAYADGAESLTRKKAEMKATLGNLQETIATALLPAFHEIITTMQPMIEKIAENIKLWFENKENVEKLTGTLKAIITVFGTVISTIGKVIGLFYAMGEGLGLAAFNIVQFVGKAREKFDEFKENAIGVFTGVKDWAVDTMTAMKEAVVEKFNSMLSFIKTALQKAKDTAKEIATLGFANTKTYNTSSSSGTSGARANGGGVIAGKAYTVGERGMETFIPATNGTIVPNGGVGNSIDKIEINVNGSGDPMQTAAIVKQELTNAMQMYNFGIS